ncbi:MAG: SAM-dependent methyltransferase [Verrucomicrobia bacterium]|nr:SAM-dependent methyltransferase [Verrucomicrobiota bacterium]
MTLPPAPSPIESYIRAEIGRHGPVSFKWFMQQALYHPEFGYYASGRARIGRAGDFITSVSVSRIYGELMARQFEEMWLRMGSPVSFTIVEEGAHEGDFANDVLRWLRRFSPELFATLRYWIVEPGAGQRARQEARLCKWPRNKVRWSPGLDRLPAGSLCGVHFSNELIDAFPVHLVTYAAGQWQENFVDFTKNGFRFTYGPPSNRALSLHLETLPVPPAHSQPYRTEVNLQALRWIEDVSRLLRQGYVLVADYGYPREQFYAPERNEGTLTGYRAQGRNADPFQFIGEADITAHVEFTSLTGRAEARGLQFLGYCDQHHFLVGLGREDLLAIEQRIAQAGQPPDEETRHYLRAFQSLMHPSTMGMAFKFLGFGKRLPEGANDTPLSGFAQAGEDRGRSRLGLGALVTHADPHAEDPYAPF